MKTEAQKKLSSHRALESYLTELYLLTGLQVGAHQLSSLQEVAAIVEKSNVLTGAPKSSFEIGFADKTGEHFARFIARLHCLNPGPVYIWTPRTTVCGLFEINSVLGLNLGFPFNINPEGIFNLTAKNLKDEIVFDFSEDCHEQVLTVELRGTAWSAVKYKQPS